MKWYEKLLTALVTNLLKVKSIVTLSIVFTFCFLSMCRVDIPTEFMVIATSVITYYFSKSDKTR